MKTGHIYVVMGVSGCGKSSVGKLLAQRLGVPFFDGDDFHSPENVKKMRAGNALNDSDREGWLDGLNLLAKRNLQSGAVIACSALKETYRSRLRREIGRSMRFVYLEGSFDIIWERLQKRKNHFMPVALLQSQFDALHPPKNAITVSINKSPETILSEILQYIDQKKGSNS
ncbi:MAG: gluconokinase [Bacteroidota bacterium]